MGQDADDIVVFEAILPEKTRDVVHHVVIMGKADE